MYPKSILGKLLKRVSATRNISFLEEYRKITRREVLLHDGANIIVAPVCFDNAHIFEAIFSRKAVFEGKRVHAFLCGMGVKYCEKIGVEANCKMLRCQLCYQNQRDYVDNFGVEPYFIGQELSADKRKQIAEYIELFFKNSNRIQPFYGIDISKILLSAMQRYCLEADPVMKDDTITRGFLNTILTTIVSFDNLCKRVLPQYVLVSHGTYSTWGAVLEYCKTQGIQVVVWGRVYNNGGLYFSNNETYLKEMVTGDESEWKNKLLTPRQRKLIVDYLNRRTADTVTGITYDYNKNQRRRFSKKEICEKLEIPQDSILVSMFPNIPWDGSVSGVSEAVGSYRDWLFTTIEFFKERKNVYLLIRTHPAEMAAGAEIGNETLSTLLNKMYNELPTNVIVIPADSSINSYAVGQASSFGILYCSTVGMELAYLGVPVICAGPSPLFKKDIFYDAVSRDQYKQLLKTGVEGGLSISEERRERLLKFSYYNCFTRVLPETFIHSEDGVFKKLLFDDENAIKNDPALDKLFQLIEKADVYNFDEFY